MPAGPIGDCWVEDSWEDTAWEEDSWFDSSQIQFSQAIIEMTCSTADVELTFTTVS